MQKMLHLSALGSVKTKIWEKWAPFKSPVLAMRSSVSYSTLSKPKSCLSLCQPRLCSTPRPEMWCPLFTRALMSNCLVWRADETRLSYQNVPPDIPSCLLTVSQDSTQREITRVAMRFCAHLLFQHSSTATKEQDVRCRRVSGTNY